MEKKLAQISQDMQSVTNNQSALEFLKNVERHTQNFQLRLNRISLDCIDDGYVIVLYALKKVEWTKIKWILAFYLYFES